MHGLLQAEAGALQRMRPSGRCIATDDFPGGSFQKDDPRGRLLGLGHEGELRVHVADGHPPQGAPLLLSVGYSDLQGHFKQPAGGSFSNAPLAIMVLNV